MHGNILQHGATGARARGMTLIEILVVLVLIGIVMGIVGGNFIGAGREGQAQGGEDRDRADRPDARPVQARGRPLPDVAGGPAGTDHRAGRRVQLERPVLEESRRSPRTPGATTTSTPHPVSTARTTSFRSAPTARKAATARTRTSPVGNDAATPRFRAAAWRHAARAPDRAFDHGFRCRDRHADPRRRRVDRGAQKRGARARVGAAPRTRAGDRAAQRGVAGARHRRAHASACRRTRACTACPRRSSIKLFTAQRDVVNENVGAIRFFPDGGSNGGRITLAAGERKFDVDVDWLTGRVAILN